MAKMSSPSKHHHISPTQFAYIPSDNIISRTVKAVKKSTTSAANPEFLTTQIISFPRRPRSGHRVPTTWNKNKFVFEGESEDSCSGEMIMVKHEGKSHIKDVEIKFGVTGENKRELEGLSVVYVKGEEVDLNFLARVADGAYERKLASLTERMSRAHLIGFMESLQGEWCGRSERRKVVDAAEFVKALPVDWKIELALRHRAGLPSVYCRSYVSPSGKHFKSCKDAAAYLRHQSLTDVASPFQEGQMRQINNGCHTLPKSEVNGVAGCSSVVEEADVDLSTTGQLYDVKVSTLIECSPCGEVFQNMRDLERHLATFHKETTRRFELPIGTRDFEKHADMDLDEEPVHVINEKFKTNCTWCNKEFICEAVDTETMEDASGFMCPQCKDKLCGAFERSLLKSYKH